MKVDTKKTGACRVKVTVKAEADETRQAYEETLATISKTAQVPGFRVGKVPVEVIKRDFHQQLTDTVQRRLFQELYPKALEQEGLVLEELVGLDDMIFSPETGFLFSMIVDTVPEFNLPKYEKIPLKVDKPVVTDEMVDNYITAMQQRFASYIEVDEEYQLQQNDLAYLTFNSQFKDLDLEALAANERVLVENKGHWMRLGEDNGPLNSIVELLPGMKKEESRKGVAVTFPADFPIVALQGKTGEYSFTITSTRSCVLPDQEALCKNLHFPGVEELRKFVGEQLMHQAVGEQRKDIRFKIEEFLLKKNEFDIPESRVNEEMGRIFEAAFAEELDNGVSVEEIKQEHSEFLKTISTKSERRVRLEYMLKKIADLEDVKVQDSEIDTMLHDAATKTKQKLAAVKKRLVNNGKYEDIRNSMRAEKAMDQLVDGVMPE